MDRTNPEEAAEFLKAIEAQKAKRFPPQVVAPLAGRFQHFATEADRQAHLAHVEKHRNETPF